MATDGGEAAPLASGDCYKKTAIGDYVVKRQMRVYPTHFTTARYASGESHEYGLTPGITLVPADPESIGKRTRRVRPEGVGHLTALAAAAGKGREIDLHSFKLEWDSWHHFHFGFESLDVAKEFHRAITSAVEKLRTAEAAAQEAAFAAAAAAAEGSAFASGGGAAGVGADGKPRHLSTADSVPMIVERKAATRAALAGHPIGSQGSLDEVSSDDEDGQLSALWHFAPGTTTSSTAGKRWVPYRHTNGIAIYKHCGRGASGGGQHAPDGDEYMVSAVVRGRPTDALRVLVDPASSTTILGPAREVEVMESTRGKQLLRIVVQAAGVVGSRLAPREAVVERMLRRESAGIYVLLFNSVDTSKGDDAFAGQGVVEEAEGLDDGSSLNRGMWGGGRPVRCRAGGGFIISRLAGADGSGDSDECLVTLVLNVQDLGGWLSPGIMRRLVAPTGFVSAATEALVERMLMAVMLVRDTVEQARFAIHPGLMRAQQQPTAIKVSDASEIALQRSATVVMRRAQRSAAGGSSASSAAAAANAALGVARMSRLASMRAPSLPAPAAVVEEGAEGAEAAAAAGDEPQVECSLPRSCYEELHTPGHDSPFKVRGPHYTTDGGKKVTAGLPVFDLVGVELLETDGPVTHVSRYLPSVRRSPRAFLFVYNLIVPGPPTLSLAFVYGTDTNPHEALAAPPEDPDEGDWTPFDWLMYRFLKGTDEDRASLFKMIPHIAEGSWVIKSAVGTTPVIVARKLASTFFITDKYVEVCVDVGSNSTANYVTGMVRGATKSLVIDLALLLEGRQSYELPETLIGACRMLRLDLGLAKPLDTSQELPIRHVKGKGAAAATAAAAAATCAAAAAAADAPEEEVVFADVVEPVAA